MSSFFLFSALPLHNFDAVSVSICICASISSSPFLSHASAARFPSSFLSHAASTSCSPAPTMPQTFSQCVLPRACPKPSGSPRALRLAGTLGLAQSLCSILPPTTLFAEEQQLQGSRCCWPRWRASCAPSFRVSPSLAHSLAPSLPRPHRSLPSAARVAIPSGSCR
jgi:hypothetical protein